MQPPLYSTIALFAELLVTAAVFFSMYRGYKYGKFPAYLAGFALAYEIIFNISYMLSRELGKHPVNLSIASPAYVALAAFHGIFSLVMFIALLVFFISAWRNYSKGINYFREHRGLTLVFSVCWAIAILSGMLFYWVSYLA